MNAPRPPQGSRRTRSLVRWLDASCDEFEAAWKAGQQPRIETFLGRVAGPERAALLRELLGLELELRRDEGDSLRREEYLARLPGYAAEVEAAFAEQSSLNLRPAPAGDSWVDAPPGATTLTGVDVDVDRGLDEGAGQGRGDDRGGRVARGPSPANRALEIPGYEIEGVLGRGGMGVVYLAWHAPLKRRCALKMIIAGADDDDDVEMRVRFLSEAETVARLEHPNVVRIHRIGDHEGRLYLELEYVAGGSLASRLDGTPWPPRAAAELVEPLAGAAAAAHALGIVHRDLKPANVLIAADGTPKVSDFGVAKSLDVDSDLTRTGAIVGTPSYMAPEQAMSRHERVGPWSDIYSLGAILYELLTGRPPFKAATVMETLEQVKATEPVPPSRLQPGLPRDVETIVLKCLAKEPSRRYEAAEALADDLRRFLEGRPVRARRAGALERAWRWCRRNPWLAAAAGAVAASLGAVVLLSFLHAARQAEARAKTTHLANQLAESLAVSNRRLSVVAFEHGLADCERGDVGLGLLWLSETLRTTTAQDPAWRRLVWLNLTAWKAAYPELKLVLSHATPLWGVAYSPDGRTILTGSSDGELRFWDAATGRRVGPTLEGVGTVTAAAYSPDGKTLLIGNAARVVQFRDATTGAPIGKRLKYPTRVVCAAFSPDGRSVLIGLAGGTARLWDIASGRQPSRPFRHEKAVEAVAFSPDGKTLATGSLDGTARLWDAATGRPIGPPQEHQGAVRDIAFSPDGGMVLVAAGTRARFWSVADGKATGPALAHEGRVTAVAYSPDGRTVATASWDRTARLWDAATGQPIGPPRTHLGRIDAVAFSPDGKAFVTGSQDRTARVWGAVDETPPLGEFLSSQSVRAVAFRPDGKVLLTGSLDGTGRLWDAATGRPIGGPHRHEDFIHAVAFSPDGRTVAEVGQQRTAWLWDAATGRAIGPPLEHSGDVMAVAFSPDGTTLITGGTDQAVRFWDTATGRPLRAPLGLGGQVQALAFRPDGKAFLVGLRSGTAQQWDAATGRPIGPTFAHQDWVGAVAYGRDGKTILTGGHDGEARLWDAATGQPIGPPLVHSRRQVLTVAISPDGRTILTGGQEQMARLWDAATMRPIGPPLEHQRWVTSLAFSPDGKTFLTPSGLHPVRAPGAEQEPDDPRRVLTWIQAVTGLALNEDGALRALDNAEWLERLRALARAGGPLPAARTDGGPPRPPGRGEAAEGGAGPVTRMRYAGRPAVARRRCVARAVASGGPPPGSEAGDRPRDGQAIGADQAADDDRDVLLGVVRAHIQRHPVTGAGRHRCDHDVLAGGMAGAARLGQLVMADVRRHGVVDGIAEEELEAPDHPMLALAAGQDLLAHEDRRDRGRRGRGRGRRRRRRGRRRRRDGQGDRGRRAQVGPVVGLVGEAVGAGVARRGDVAERAVGVERQAAVGRRRDELGRQGRVLRVGVVGEHAGRRHRQRHPLLRRVAVARGDGDIRRGGQDGHEGLGRRGGRRHQGGAAEGDRPDVGADGRHLARGVNRDA
jgi:WD40 repeat protein